VNKAKMRTPSSSRFREKDDEQQESGVERIDANATRYNETTMNRTQNNYLQQ